VRGNPWSFRKGGEEIEIAPLVSPLRFDVTIRQAFFTFYAEHRDLYRSDFRAFAELARGEEYFVWFEKVMCRAWQPHVLEDARLFDTAWAQRLHAAAALHDSFERAGFDTHFPITLYEGRDVLPTAEGKRVSRKTYAGDGNHRLALLLAAGRTTLLPSQYRIKRYRRLIPSDTTPRLVQALQVDDQRYLAFLRAGYPGLGVEKVDGRIEVTGSPDAAVATEVRNLLRIDRPDPERETE
jgi:hypothetical protein